MKMRFLVSFVLLSLALGPSARAQVPQLINYQGRLIDGTNLVNGITNLSLRIFNVSSGGSPLYEDSNNVMVVDGLYSTFIGDDTTLGSLTNALAGTNVYLEVMVGGDALSPRERIVSAGYALLADRAAIASTVDDGSITGAKIQDGAISAANVSTNLDSLYINEGQFGSISSAMIVDGTISAADVASNTFWQLNGNANTTAGTHFLGSTDNQPLELRVNNIRALLLQPGGGHPNVIGGDGSNVATSGVSVAGAVIAGGSGNAVLDNYTAIGGGYSNTARGTASTIGGGRFNSVGGSADAATIGGGTSNSATAAHATVGGGQNNSATQFSATVGGGLQNSADGITATVAGGQNNTANANLSTVAGGFGNSALGVGTTVGGGESNAMDTNTADSAVGGGSLNNILQGSGDAFIGGGEQNTIGENAGHAAIGGGEHNVIASSAAHAVIGGGYYNHAGGIASMVPGGQNNDAANTLTFAAGNRAKAGQPGSFVWADSTDADFASSGNNQFLIRATGGIYEGPQDTNLWLVSGMKIVTNADVTLYTPYHVGSQLLDVGSNRIYYAVGTTTNDWKGANLN